MWWLLICLLFSVLFIPPFLLQPEGGWLVTACHLKGAKSCLESSSASLLLKTPRLWGCGVEHRQLLQASCCGANWSTHMAKETVACCSLASEDKSHSSFSSFLQIHYKGSCKRVHPQGFHIPSSTQSKNHTRNSQICVTCRSGISIRSATPAYCCIVYTRLRMMNGVSHMKEQTYSTRQWQSAGLQEFIKTHKWTMQQPRSPAPNCDWRLFLL